MVRNRVIIFLLTVFLSLINLNINAQVVRILPLGNSITYDNNVYDVPPNVRPIGDRISYRYKLYQLLTEAGYTFDYVGSENGGDNYFQNPEMDDNGGFPGMNKSQMNYLLLTGYNQRDKQYEAPGPYLNYYPADIILLHIGTVDLDADPDPVEDILDNIRIYLPDAFILIARIIDRVPHSELTTTFNDNVQAMVTARGDDRIIWVNMETGAGLNYSFSGDMTDYLHPNQNGYNKMAVKWFEAIDNLNAPPVISSIPGQSAIQETAFANLYLDGYVTDAEDNANLIQWTCRLQNNSKFSAYVDGNRVLHVTATDNNWYGSETITLKATDTGNGAFRKSDSTEVTYTVVKKNEPPVFTSTPVTSVNEDNNYNYTATAHDNDGDILTFSAVQKPTWLSFSSSTHTLSGRPTNNEVGVFDITLRVTDGNTPVDQNYQLTVYNVNDPPVITSIPSTTALIGETYLYELSATDVDVGDVITYSYSIKPAWLTFTNGGDKGTIYGDPSLSNLGPNAVILKVNDGHVDVIQGITINVVNQTSIEDENQSEQGLIYPNPAQDRVILKIARPATIRLQFFDLTGILKKDIFIENTQEIEIDISEFSNGIYLYKANIDDIYVIGKLTKID